MRHVALFSRPNMNTEHLMNIQDFWLGLTYWSLDATIDRCRPINQCKCIPAMAIDLYLQWRLKSRYTVRPALGLHIYTVSTSVPRATSPTRRTRVCMSQLLFVDLHGTPFCSVLVSGLGLWTHAVAAAASVSSCCIIIAADLQYYCMMVLRLPKVTWWSMSSIDAVMNSIVGQPHSLRTSEAPYSGATTNYGLCKNNIFEGPRRTMYFSLCNLHSYLWSLSQRQIMQNKPVTSIHLNCPTLNKNYRKPSDFNIIPNTG